jgi:CPA2 family monovalent cation:H+ antiporter-2
VHAPAFLEPLAIVFFAALVSAYLLHRLRQPPLIGFLLAGALVGPFGLGLTADTEAIATLADAGVVLLLFTVGLELELPNLKRLGRVVWVAGSIQVVGTIGLVAAVGLLRGYELRRAAFFGFLVALSSTAILLTLLVERRELDSLHGKLLVAILIFQDLAVVPMMLAVPYLAGGQAHQGIVGALVALAKTAAAAAFLVVAARLIIPRLLRALAGTQQKAVFVVAVLFIVLGTALATSLAGLSAALGAFLAGLAISESDYGHQAMADIAPFRDAFNALFFVSIGMLFDPRLLLSRPGEVATILALILVGKTAVGALPVAFLGYGPRTALVVGLSLAQIGEFSFVLLSQGLAFNLISGEHYQAFLGAAILSMLATPFLTDRSHSVAARFGKAAESLGGERLAARGSAAEGHVIVLGFGHMGETLARVLGRAHVTYRVLDLSPERVARGRQKDVPIEYGDATSDLVLKRAGVPRARAAILLLSDPRATRQALRLCRQLAPRIFLLVRTRYLADIPDLSALGADEVVAEEFETSFEISRRTLGALGLPVPWLEDEASEKRHAQEAAFRRLTP